MSIGRTTDRSLGVALALAILVVTILAPAALAQIEGDYRGSVRGGDAELVLEAGMVETDTGVLVRLDVPQIGSFGLMFKGTLSGDELRLAHRDGESFIDIIATRQGDEFVGQWASEGTSQGQLTLRRVGNLSPPLERRAVEFRSGDVILRGEVLLPPGDGPFPAMVWTHGSGTVTRSNVMYARDANFLARHGVASLLYDKRGCGESRGDWRRATFHDLARDAIAGGRALASMPEIDADRIGIGGLSQGAWISPLACVLGGEFAFVIGTSASGVAPAYQHNHMIETRLRTQGFDEAQVESAGEVLEAVAEVARTGAGADRVNRMLADASREPWFGVAMLPPAVAPPDQWMRSWIFFDPLPAWERVDVPVLLYWGDSDYFVNVERSQRLIGEALADNPDATLRLIEGADHMMQMFPHPNSPFEPIAPEVQPMLVEWLRERFIR